MKNYTLTTSKSWHQTMIELEGEFKFWGVTEWETNYPKGARSEARYQDEQDRLVTLTYKKDGRTVSLSMNKQKRAIDNLRVLYLAIEAMRMNERRGIGEIIASAYLQLQGPEGLRDPYEVLGVARGLDLEVYNAVYRTMVDKYHPDRKSSGSAEKFKEISKAIETIRKEYDNR